MPDPIVVDRLTNDDLTQTTISGSGTFDVLMRAFKSHLREEFDAGRITGSDYAKAYIQLTTAAMGNAVQYLLGRDSAYLQAANLQYQLEQMLPEQLALLREQTETARAQTLDHRRDGALVLGSVGKQKELYGQQITSYKRDAEVKAAKVFADAWTVQKTMDEGLLPPDNFTNTNVNRALQKLMVENQF